MKLRLKMRMVRVKESKTRRTLRNLEANQHRKSHKEANAAEAEQ
jgi:hypothetical protein